MKMQFAFPALLATSLSIGLLVVGGCSNEAPTGTAATSSSTSEEWKSGLDAEVVTALSKLSDADRQAALQQKVCPVTDKLLGSMGAPPKVTIAGQDVFLCCDGCESEIKSKPDEYLAKLKTGK